LLLAILAGALAAAQQPAHPIAAGQTVEGRLSKADVLSRDRTYVQEWQIEAAEGEVVTIDLASDSMDVYLLVYGPGLATDLQDDDAGGNCNARLTVRFPERGVYHIAVTSTEERQTGPFSLQVTSGPKPKALSRCRRNR
jgi:hypothetical protein